VAQAVERTAADRREAILDVAERLIRTKGYERMSVQEVQDELGVSRGAIYHYFGSKDDLLMAVLERTSDRIMAVLGPIVEAPTPAAEKLQRFFLEAGHWKTEQRELVRRLVDVWVSDVNAIARVKLRRLTSTRLLPLMVDIVRQGHDEGVFTVSSPGDTARVLADLLQATGDTATELLMAHEEHPLPLAQVRRAFDAYDEAVERILGLAPNTFTFMDDQTLRAWFA
jgi:AcrR family transcriptional regulator